MMRFANVSAAFLSAFALSAAVAETATAEPKRVAVGPGSHRSGPPRLHKHRHATDGYGRGYEGFDPTVRYGAVGTGYEPSGRWRWGYDEGFPVFVYPIDLTAVLKGDGEYEQFRREEQEAVAIEVD